VGKLVYFERTGDVHAAIAREKQIKAGSRQKKIDLINSINPEWNDLAEEMHLSPCHCGQPHSILGFGMPGVG
jgi:predicted GIY-YIG superfamily endonuclease